MTLAAKPSFFSELQRRHVYKVGASYAVAGWLLVQVATQVFPFFDVPNVAVRVVVLVVVAGFPVALVLAWLFDLTPQGIVRTGKAGSDGIQGDTAAMPHGVDRKLNYLLGVLLTTSLGYLLLEHTVLRGPLAGPNASSRSAQPDRSIAVLPFENLSDDKANAYFASGIQDEVLTQLAKIGDLKVISRTSTEHYASQPENLPAIAKELGVGNILEGSVQKAGDSVHINVQLINAATDAHLWAESYDRKLDNIFGVEGEVAADISGQLKAKLTGAEKTELARKPTQNAAAYDFFLKAQATEEREFSRATMEAAVDDYKQAIAADPGFAEAWIGQANARINIYTTFVHRPEDQALIKQEIEEALRLQAELPEAWRTMGRYQRDIARDYQAAAQALEHALRLAPNDATSLLSISLLNTKLRHWDEAFAQSQRAAEVDPRNPRVWALIASIAESLRRYGDVEQALKRENDLVKDKGSLSMEFADLYLTAGDLDHAKSSLAPVPFDFRDPQVYLTYSRYWRYTHKYQEGIDTWTRELSDTATHPPEDLVTGIINRGEIYACAGKQDEASADFQNARKRLMALRDSGATNYEIPAFLGPVEAALGLEQEALSTSRHLLEEVANNPDYEPWARTQLARVEMITGDPDAALADLEASFREPDGISVGALKFDCIWDPLRSKPRFQKLLKRVEESVFLPQT